MQISQRNTLGYVLILILAVAHFILPWRYAVNIPNADDFDIILTSVLRILDAETMQGAYASLLSRHGEHYTVFARLFALVQLYIWGEFNFRVLVLLGNLAIPLSLLILFFADRRRKDESLYIFLPVCLLVLQPQYVESIMWASGVSQHLCVVPFVFGAIFFSQKSHYSMLFLSFLLAVIAIFTQGNGIFIFPIIALLAFSQKRYPLCFTSALVGAAFFSLHVGSLQNLSDSQGVTYSFGEYLYYVMAFLGSLLSGDIRGAVILGAFILILSLLCTATGAYRRSPILYGLLLFFILTALANALARISYGIDFGFSNSRYRLISALTCAILWLLWVRGRERVQSKPIVLAVIICTAIFNVWSYASNYAHFVLRYELLRDSALRWQVGQTGLEYPSQAHAVAIFRRALSEGVYTLPEIDIESFLMKPEPEVKMPLLKEPIRLRLEHVIRGEKYALISGYAFFKQKRISHTDTDIRVRLLHGESALSIRTQRRFRPDVVQHFQRPDLLYSGFFALIPVEVLEHHDYAIEIELVYNKESRSRRLSRRTI